MDNLTKEELMKLDELAREKKNAYARQWRKDNPKKARQHLENYWRKKALKELNKE